MCRGEGLLRGTTLLRRRSNCVLACSVSGAPGRISSLDAFSCLLGRPEPIVFKRVPCSHGHALFGSKNEAFSVVAMHLLYLLKRDYASEFFGNIRWEYRFLDRRNARKARERAHIPFRPSRLASTSKRYLRASSRKLRRAAGIDRRCDKRWRG